MFTEQEFGVDAVGRVLADLSAEDRAVLSDVQAIGWYPVEPVLRYHRSLDRIYGKGDLELCVRAGRFSAGWSLNTVLKVFLRFKSPTWLIDRATRVWDRYHDTGQWTVTTPLPNKFVGELTGFGVRDVGFCARLRGWLAGAVELTGGSNAVTVETKCACRGSERCVFAVSWDP
ncbi:MAG TPA: 4-vinyl reductase, partial [Polyangiaceae bacterium]|jgi:hypothetical protein|nr:4-vinyl reductase [Polyangiaceae bacterium]